MRGRLVSRPAPRCCARRRSWSRRGARAAGHQPGHLGLWHRPQGARGERSPILGSPAISAARRLGAAPLCLPLPACARAGAADGRGAGAALSRHPVPARPPRHAAPHGAAGGGGEDARRDRGLARGLPRDHLRSTFIVGYPGETEAEFQTLLDWLDEARLDRVGCFRYEDVAGARSNALPGPCARGGQGGALAPLHGGAQAISAKRSSPPRSGAPAVIVDEVDAEAATCRTMAPTRPRSTGTCSSTRASRASRPATS
jgi:hypothetical protein